MIYVFGACALDVQRRVLYRAGQVIPLRRKVFQALTYLLTSCDRAVSKEELCQAVWPQLCISDAALESTIRAVRRAIGESGRAPALLQTVHGYGYRIVAPVESHDQAPPLTPLAGGPLPVMEVPPHLPPPPAVAPTAGVEAALAGPTVSQANGEYKLVSVLCGGLLEAPTLVTTLGPEGLYQVLQTMVALAQEVCQAYGGTLTPQPSGEGFTVVFGVPVTQEDHARRAVLAAVDLQQRLREHPTLRPPACNAGLAFSLGVHSGLVVVGGVAPDPQRLVTAVGVPIQVATRLQQQAAPGTLLVSAATYHLVQAEVRGEPCGSLALNGRQEPLPVYAVQGLGPRRAGVPQRARWARSPFVGRQRELALLHERLEAVRTGEGQIVSLVGPAGAGKTRLLTEFERCLTPDQVTWYGGHCLAYGQAMPYLPVRDVVQQVCALAPGGVLETRLAAVRRRLAALGGVTEADVALVLQLLDLPVAAEMLGQHSPEARRARTFALLRRLINHEAQRQPLVLAVENVHWIDPTSEAWLQSLVERLVGMPVLLLVTARPGYLAPWAAHATVTRLALPPLRAQESQKIVEAVPGAAQLPVARRQQIVAHGAGNPFFVEELIWHAVEHGPAATPVPETVQAVLAARIDQLPAEAKALLQTAAVLGPEVPVPLLQAITELPEDALQRCLAHLQTAEFLYETRLVPEQIYTFKHALTHEVAYCSLLQKRRRALHARIVAALEALVGDRVAEVAAGATGLPAARQDPDQVERLAHHALQGEVWEKALAYCRQAGEKAMTRSAYREAVGYFEQALGAFAHLPEQRDTCEQAIDLRLALCAALRPLDDFRRILVTLREAEALAATLDNPRRLGQVSCFLSLHLYRMSAHDQAITAAQRALALATADGDSSMHALANQFLGCSYWAKGDYRWAIDCFGQTLRSLKGPQRCERFGQAIPPAVLSSTLLTACHAERGTFLAGSTCGEEGLQVAEAIGHPASLMWAYYGIGLLCLRQGDLRRALPRLERAVGICQDADLPVYFPLMAAALGAAYILCERDADAVPLLTQALEQTMATGRVTFQVLCRLSLGEAHVRADRLEEAHALAAGALTIAREHQERGHEAYALHLLGDIAARHDPLESEPAKAHYRQALTLAEELGMRPLQAHCHHGLGRLYHQTSRAAQARAALSTAIALYRAMEMTFWLPQAEAALAQVEGR